MATDSSTVIVRVIRSFPHRNIRNVVLKNVALTQTCEQFDDLVKAEIKTASLPPPFRTYQYDTFKVEPDRLTWPLNCLMLFFFKRAGGAPRSRGQNQRSCNQL